MQVSCPDEATITSFLHREDARAQQAFGYIVDLHSRRLYSTIRRWTGNHEDTNDVLQDVFLKVWKHRHQFQGNSALFSWMYRIAYNETMQFLQKAKKHRADDMDHPLVEFAQSASHYGKVSADEISAWLMEAVERLPEKQRLVFEYKYFDDLKYEEIAQLTGGSVGGLKANYFHATQKIEEYLLSRLNH